jgi:hypothetical protein
MALKRKKEIVRKKDEGESIGKGRQKREGIREGREGGREERREGEKDGERAGKKDSTFSDKNKRHTKFPHVFAINSLCQYEKQPQYL